MKLFSIKGRAGRAEYFWVSVIAFLLMLILIMAPSALGLFDNNNAANGIYTLVVIAAYFISEACLTIRRLHDLDRPSYQFFYLFIPLYNIYFGILLRFEKGAEFPNQYGPDPLIKKKEEQRFPTVVNYIIATAGLIAVFYFIMEYRSVREHEDFITMKSNPEVGDLYIYNADSDDEFDYQILKLREIDSSYVIVSGFMYAFAYKSGAEDAIQEGKTDYDTLYYEAEILERSYFDSLDVKDIIRK